MIKKTEASKMAAGAEEMIAVNNSAESNHSSENHSIPVEHPQLQEKVNLVIHEWLTDMWLLTTGEEIEEEFVNSRQHNGWPLAFVCDGQMKLVGSKVRTLNALRAVGIEMS